MDAPHYSSGVDSSPESYPEFKLPEGVELEGESGEATCTWKKKEGGMICLTQFNGTPLGSEEESEKPSEPDPDDDKMGPGAMDAHMNQEG